jgi:hypothetical protein
VLQGASLQTTPGRDQRLDETAALIERFFAAKAEDLE